MDKELALKQTEAFVRETLTGDASGHDWWHIHRVRRLALELGKAEGADLFIVELAALLHDLDDYKLVPQGDGEEPLRAREWLEQMEVSKQVTDHICQIIKEISFKGARVESKMTTPEGMIVQDADRLDAIGAIGIARAFAYGGARGRLMHDPEVPAVMHASFEDYKKNSGPTINHFYEKLLLLKERMNTRAGKQIAATRHEFVEQFLGEFLNEWDGKA
jgi:uncharacterized protein